jgi:hypothetical protein
MLDAAGGMRDAAAIVPGTRNWVSPTQRRSFSMARHRSLFEACVDRCMILQVMAKPGEVTRLSRKLYWPQLVFLANAATSEGLVIV